LYACRHIYGCSTYCKPLPTVTVTPTSGCGGVAGTNGLQLTASGGDSYAWSPIAGLFTNATATTAYTAGTNTNTVYAAPTAFTAYVVTGTNAVTGCSNRATALINYTPPAPNVTPNPAVMCLGDSAVRITSSSATSTTVTFNSGALTVAVPDNNPTGVTTTLPVSGIPANATISNITVAINMTHTWDGDMAFALKAPNNNVLNLIYFLSGTGGTAATTGFTNTRISSTGTAAISTGTNPYNGVFRADAVITGAFGSGGPTGFTPNVTNFNGLTSVPNGTWTLGMWDGGPADLGTLTSWSIQITYVVGVPATPATWSPVTHLFMDKNATVPYTAGTQTDTIYAKPTPSGTYTYAATINSLPPTPAVASTNFAVNNSNSTITFNVRNNNAFPVTLANISSVCNAAGASVVSAYYKTSAINGLPGAISAANGWTLLGTANITGLGGGAVQPFLTGLSLTIPPGATYGICVEALLGGGFNLAYSTIAAGTYTFSAGGCDIITGTGVGYGGTPVPAAPTFTPRGFIGGVGFVTTVPTCTSPARTVTVTVNQPVSITTQPVNTSVCTDKATSFTAVAAGTTPSHNWRVSADNGNTWNDVVNGGVYSGAKTATLTITAPPVSMNGYLFRDSVTGAAPCTFTRSLIVRLTVNPLPTVGLTASPYLKLFPGLRTTLFATSSPAAAPNGFAWRRNGSTVANASTNTLVVDVDGLGDYTVTVTDINGCVNTSNVVSLTDSASGKLFVYPNPNTGQFQVRYYSTINNIGLPRGINIYDARGKRIMTNNYSIATPYARMDVDLRSHGHGVYWVELVDVNGNRLAIGRVVTQ
jgi:subtilisin-like proprotein convertase family protein